MPKYQDLLQQIETLKKQAEDVRKEELRTVIAEIKEKMAAFGITVEDLGGKGGRKSTGTVKAKYRDPASGATWTGRGRAPKWVTEAESRGVKRETFLI
jgi:DNA-binding protein H-NS